MTQAPVPTSSGPGVAPERPVVPVVQGRRVNFAPSWLQVVLIVGLLGGAVFVMVNEHYLWGVLLAVAGGAFGLSFVLRRMVGDEYGRT